ncbi:MAG: hypothetical protein C0623_03245 [Desulfuromonas sp.]|nr:MAG: hypothetical protein C0623_03245 [Desulfuromonas sp.]
MKLIATTYEKLEHRRTGLTIALLVLLLIAGGLLSRLEVEQSIVAMLPDGDSRVASDFGLLQQAPFARKLVIHLRAEPDVPLEQLLAATDRLRAALPADLFRNLLSGPTDIDPIGLTRGLGNALPFLLEADDLEQIEQQLTPEKIDRQLATRFAELLQPQGIALKESIRHDPLGLQQLAFAKLGYLNPLPGVRIEQGQFVSADGRSSLLLADTPALITDAVAGRKLVDAFAGARRVLPVGITADLLSGHPYTLANAEAIQKDMQRVLVVSGVGILLLFTLFLRRLHAVAVFLLPLFCIAAALVITSLWFGRVSGITIGFGAVLLGITIDFGLHVYFALQHGSGLRPALLKAVSRPVLFGGLTTLAAFSILLNSDLPGQRQLAIFAMAGIITALMLALLVLPHYVGSNSATRSTRTWFDLNRVFREQPNLRWVVVLLWFGVAMVSAFEAQNMTINGELRQLSYRPEELRRAEQSLADVWGRMRDRALVFVAAETMDDALDTNQKVWQLLKQQQVESEAVSLAPLIAAPATQQQRLDNWQRFWQRNGDRTSRLVQSAGLKYGFSGDAFQPFFDSLERTPEPISTKSLEQWGLGGLLDNLAPKKKEGAQLISLIPDRPQLIEKLEPSLAAIPGVTLVSQSRFGRQLSREIAADFANFIIYAGLAVLMLLLLLFRRIQDVLLALLPVLTGLLAMFGGMGWLGIEMNLFNVIATILIIGLGVDYGIFMVCHSRQTAETASTRAIVVSGLTTLVGFGALILARHPALHSIGLTVLLGISAAVPTAVLVIPAFRPRSG